MKNYFFKLIITVLVTIFLNINFMISYTSAAESIDNGVLKITGGMLEPNNDVYVTFDRYRTITGLAKEGTIIKIINNIIRNNIIVDVKEYEFIVGASGIFSKDVALEVGQNNIQIYANIKNENCNLECIVKRLSLDIKEEIEITSIVLPGSRKNFQFR